MKNFELGLTYDDVLLVPQRSKVAHRGDVSTDTLLTKNITLSIPLVSANMDTVTEANMAIALAQEGGIGIIHRFMTAQEEVDQVKKVKRHVGFIRHKPFTILLDANLSDAIRLSVENGISSFVVVDKKDKVAGILTRRDLLFETDLKKPINLLMTPFSRLIYADEDIKTDQAQKILKKHKIEKLPLLDKNKHLIGLITAKSLEGFASHPRATKDKHGRLKVGAAIGVVGDYIERTKMLLDVGVDTIVIDVAHGQNEVALDGIKKLRKKYKDIDLIGGNVATGQGVIDMIKLGVDAVKVGIGPGGLCTTRVVAGVGIPQLSAVLEACQVAKKYRVPIIADGGTNFPGDITKALAAGAHSCMLAGWFAGADESPGGIIMRKGMKFKVHRGAASFLSVADRKLESGEILDETKLNTVVPEGVEALVPYKGKVSDVIYQLLGALRSGMSYCNAKTIDELHQNARFVRITEAGFRESKSHNVEELT
ncbi:IMP dehydrogenase [Candidatus Gottesmanbacteria bacterium]|nr:IMP dehydrogenase [Candidatus Gottesmanbacteria bacterium]